MSQIKFIHSGPASDALGSDLLIDLYSLRIAILVTFPLAPHERLLAHSVRVSVSHFPLLHRPLVFFHAAEQHLALQASLRKTVDRNTTKIIKRLQASRALASLARCCRRCRRNLGVSDRKSVV